MRAMPVKEKLSAGSGRGSMKRVYSRGSATWVKKYSSLGPTSAVAKAIAANRNIPGSSIVTYAVSLVIVHFINASYLAATGGELGVKSLEKLCAARMCSMGGGGAASVTLRFTRTCAGRVFSVRQSGNHLFCDVPPEHERMP